MSTNDEKPTLQIAKDLQKVSVQEHNLTRTQVQLLDPFTVLLLDQRSYVLHRTERAWRSSHKSTVSHGAF
jgi:hypothetical protein